MTAASGPFDAGSRNQDTHLVLVNPRGQQSLWPVWCAVPAGWDTSFGPAPHEACAQRVEATRG